MRHCWRLVVYRPVAKGDGHFLLDRSLCNIFDSGMLFALVSYHFFWLFVLEVGRRGLSLYIYIHERNVVELT